MSADDETPEAAQLHDTVLLADGIVLRAQLVVQCATQIEPETEANPDGTFCGNVIEAAAEIPFEPGVVAEMAIECPACSKRISDSVGKPTKAYIPIALLVGDQVEEVPAEPAEGEELATCPTCGAVAVDQDEDAVEDGAGDVESAEVSFVEVTPEDQGGTVED